MHSPCLSPFVLPLHHRGWSLMPSPFSPQKGSHTPPCPCSNFHLQHIIRSLILRTKLHGPCHVFLTYPLTSKCLTSSIQLVVWATGLPSISSSVTLSIPQHSSTLPYSSSPLIIARLCPFITPSDDEYLHILCHLALRTFPSYCHLHQAMQE